MTRMYQGSRRLLLCVDDSPAILEYIRRIFEKSGHIVVNHSFGAARVEARDPVQL